MSVDFDLIANRFKEYTLKSGDVSVLVKAYLYIPYELSEFYGLLSTCILVAEKVYV